jgi:F-type H+-transporting ATPase subunit delta
MALNLETDNVGIVIFGGDREIKEGQTVKRTRAGRDVAIDATVNPQILGGIVVKLGSQQIDASIRTKLNRLAQAMKG